MVSRPSLLPYGRVSCAGTKDLAGDAEPARGFPYPARGVVERLVDVATLDLFECEPPWKRHEPVVGHGGLRGCRHRGLAPQHRAVAEDQGALHEVPKLPGVAGPFVLIGRERLSWLSVGAGFRKYSAARRRK